MGQSGDGGEKNIEWFPIHSLALLRSTPDGLESVCLPASIFGIGMNTDLSYFI